MGKETGIRGAYLTPVALLFNATSDMFNGPARGGGTPRADHFTAPLVRGNAMHDQSTPAPPCGQTDRPAEEVVLDLVTAGELEINGCGQVWRHKIRRGGLSYSCSPRRAENRTPLGYFQVRSLIGDRRYHVGAHRLVWWYLRHPIPAGMVINHLNGVKGDNRPENLECVTPSENTSHAHRTGLKDQRGQRNPAAKLSDHDVALIRLAYASGGVTQQELADRFGVQHQHVSYLVKGKRRSSQAGPVDPSDRRRSIPLSPTDPKEWPNG